MKNLLIFLLLIVITPLTVTGQQWSGSTPGNIYYNQGNVGIGTGSANQRLTVRGNVELGINDFLGILSTDDFTYLGKVQPHYGMQWTIDPEKTGGATLWMSGYAGMNFFTGGKSRVKVTSAGKVGIGTTNPSAILELKSEANNHSELHINTTSQNNVSILRFLHAGTNKWGFLSNYPSNTGNFILYNYSTGSQTLTITPNNQIGIGTTSLGSHKVAVNGTIGAREIKVESGAWSDFVFKEDYKLRSLKEVESFIKRHQHLPDIPSEKEVIENGIELGKMDAKLLQKIEELTLYLIQQQELIEKQQAELDRLGRKVEKLESGKM